MRLREYPKVALCKFVPYRVQERCDLFTRSSQTGSRPRTEREGTFARPSERGLSVHLVGSCGPQKPNVVVRSPRDGSEKPRSY